MCFALNNVLNFKQEQCRPVLDDCKPFYTVGIHVVTEQKLSTLTDTRLAYAVLIPDHLFLSLHNSLCWFTPSFDFLSLGN